MFIIRKVWESIALVFKQVLQVLWHLWFLRNVFILLMHIGFSFLKMCFKKYHSAILVFRELNCKLKGGRKI